jgi:serine/threonine protein kinase
MALARGARFGPYEIATCIGAGGMGEVYRAVDTDLKRDVAIKVLPPLFLSDADRSHGSNARRKCWRRSIIRTSRTSTGC